MDIGLQSGSAIASPLSSWLRQRSDKFVWLINCATSRLSLIGIRNTLGQDICRGLFRSAIYLHHQRNELSPPQFEMQVRKVERRCNQLLKQPLRRPEARKLLRRYQKLREA